MSLSQLETPFDLAERDPLAAVTTSDQMPHELLVLDGCFDFVAAADIEAEPFIGAELPSACARLSSLARAVDDIDNDVYVFIAGGLFFGQLTV
jgi:hypothetical protein